MNKEQMIALMAAALHSGRSDWRTRGDEGFGEKRAIRADIDIAEDIWPAVVEGDI